MQSLCILLKQPKENTLKWLQIKFEIHQKSFFQFLMFILFLK